MAKKQSVKEVASPKPAAKKVNKKQEDVDHGKGRKILYPKKAVAIYEKGTDQGPLTYDVAKQLIGWTEEQDGDEWGSDFDLKDLQGKKIRLLNNISNRPLRLSLAKTWEGEILYGNWQINGETMIVGKTGLCLDCQHRLVGFALACQEWLLHKDEWPEWKDMPTIDTFVVFGISEESKVVDTINTGEPRSLADVLFRDDQYFNDLPKSDRVKVAKVAEHAIRMLGHRTAAFLDAFTPQQTHSQLIEFLHRHDKLLHCVQWVYNYESESSISEIIPLGTAAALMFLMASAASTGEKYLDNDSPRGTSLDWSLMKKAEEFWRDIGDRSQKIYPIHAALSVIANTAESISKEERMGTVIKAWEIFKEGKLIDESLLTLKYQEAKDEDTEVVTKVLDEFPLLSPIDFGSPRAKQSLEPEPDDETPVEMSEVKHKKDKGKGKKNGQPIAIGDMVWVRENPVESSWRGELTVLGGTKNAKVQVPKGLAGAGKQVACLVKDLSHKQPV